MEVMTMAEQARHVAQVRKARRALAALTSIRCAEEDEDLVVAIARLRDWLTDNEGRWVRWPRL